MKLFKRIISAVLVCSIIVGMSISFLSCSSAKSEMTTGQWLTNVVVKFGIDGYNSSKPYISSISEDNEYFSVVQGAYEWGIIDGSTLDLEAGLTKGFVANTLVKAVGRQDVSDMDYDTIAQFAVDNNYVVFDKYLGKSDNGRFVTAAEADASLKAAFDIWANFDFGAPKESVKYGKDVVVLGSGATDSTAEGSSTSGDETPGVSSDDSDDSTVPSNNAAGGAGSGSGSAGSGSSGSGSAGSGSSDSGSSGSASSDDELSIGTAGEAFKSFQLDENTIAVPEEYAANLKEGDTYVVPANDGQNVTTAYVAEIIEYKDGYAIIKNDSKGATFEETVQELDASGTIQPDLSSAAVYDGNGRMVSSAVSSSPQLAIATPESGFMAYNPSSPATASPMKTSAELEFSSGGLKIKGTVDKDSVSFKVSGSMDVGDNGKVTLSKEYEVKNIKLSYDYKVDFFKLKSAYAKVDYKTVDKTKAEYKWEKEGVHAPKYTNGNGHFLSNFKRAILKDSESKGAKSIKICSIPLASGGVCSFNLDIKIKISVSGAVEVVVTTNNTKGIDFKDGSIRFIKEENKDTDLNVRVKAELTLYFGAAFKALGFDILSLGVEGGIGCKFTLTAHLADENNILLDEVSFGEVNADVAEGTLSQLNGMSYTHEEYGEVTLHCDVCHDIITYGILKFVVEQDCVIACLCNVKYEYEFIGEDNGKIEPLCFHFEDGKRMKECSREYSGKKEEETSAGETEEHTLVFNGDQIDINVYFASLSVGENQRISVEEVPAGYEVKDIRFSSADTKIASVDSSGNVKALAPGNTKVICQTSDGKYSVSCSIYVNDVAVSFTPFGGGVGGGGSR